MDKLECFTFKNIFNSLNLCGSGQMRLKSKTVLNSGKLKLLPYSEILDKAKILLIQMLKCTLNRKKVL